MAGFSADWETECRNGLEAETSPLLQSRSSPSNPNYAQTDASWVESSRTTALYEHLRKTTWYREAKVIAAWSGPLIVTYLLQRSVILTSVFAVGRIGPTELGAVSLGSITASMMGNSLIQGLATALDTLAAQAYGSGQKHLVGLHTQRMVLFIFPCVLPLMVLWWHADKILLLMLPERDLAELAGTYLRIMSVRIPAFVFFECGKRYLQAQGIFFATSYILLITAPLNALLMWLFVWHLGWGFVGAPIAIVITENLMTVMLVLYVWLVNGSECWGGLDKRAWSNWGQVIRLSVPCMLMNMAEFAFEEILTIVSAQFGATQLAAQSALITIVTVTFNISLAVSVAGSTRVANWIGAKELEAAKTSAKAAILLGLMLSLCFTAILMSLSHQIPLLFTDDVEVKAILVHIFPLATLMQVCDTMAVMSHGLLRGLGWQEFAGYFNIAAYYVVAMPISLATAFRLGWQIDGLWTGITVGLSIVLSFEYWWLYSSDWNDAVEKAAIRNEQT